ncbi:hypothetical protein VTN00DRAFT_3241 [Thermoascus crustaceus]|uniref:uncharacterized protein n=1 Tax=Thermoascus crustaceus TaxID=5088 RepID=UPI0037428D03
MAASLTTTSNTDDTELIKMMASTSIADPPNPTTTTSLSLSLSDLRPSSSPSSSISIPPTLCSPTHPSYIGPPYFSPSEAEALRNMLVPIIPVFYPGSQNKNLSMKETKTLTLADLISSTLSERLQCRLKKRLESSDFRVCAAHDLAPVFERAFGVDPKVLDKDEEFLRLLDTGGLEIRDEMRLDGLEKKKKKKKKRSFARGIRTGIRTGRGRRGGSKAELTSPHQILDIYSFKRNEDHPDLI